MKTQTKHIQQIIKNPQISGEYLIIYSDLTSELFQNNYGFIESFNSEQTEKIKLSLENLK